MLQKMYCQRFWSALEYLLPRYNMYSDCLLAGKYISAYTILEANKARKG